MNTDVLKTTILSIVFIGLVITLSGIALYCWRAQVAEHMRYLLPIPPIGVGAYVFVYNMFGKYDGNLTGTMTDTLKEILCASFLSGSFFLVFTILLVTLVNVVKNIR